jgi:DNA-directed RNA polymerase subunit RPC12/RpoP
MTKDFSFSDPEPEEETPEEETDDGVEIDCPDCSNKATYNDTGVNCPECDEN